MYIYYKLKTYQPNYYDIKGHITLFDKVNEYISVYKDKDNFYEIITSLIKNIIENTNIILFIALVDYIDKDLLYKLCNDLIDELHVNLVNEDFITIFKIMIKDLKKPNEEMFLINSIKLTIFEDIEGINKFIDINISKITDELNAYLPIILYYTYFPVINDKVVMIIDKLCKHLININLVDERYNILAELSNDLDGFIGKDIFAYNPDYLDSACDDFEGYGTYTTVVYNIFIMNKIDLNSYLVFEKKYYPKIFIFLRFHYGIYKEYKYIRSISNHILDKVIYLNGKINICKAKVNNKEKNILTLDKNVSYGDLVKVRKNNKIYSAEIIGKVRKVSTNVFKTKLLSFPYIINDVEYKNYLS